MGYNFEPSEIGAAFGLVQLKKFSKFSKIRNKNFYLHKRFFNKYKNIFKVPKILEKVQTNFLAYPIILQEDKKFSRKDFQIFLEKKGIQTRPIFSGNILRHPAFSSLKSKTNNTSSFSNADYIMRNGLLIGCHQGLNTKQIKFIHSTIINYLKKLKLLV